MIVTLTLNPSLDRTLEIDALERGEVLRAAPVHLDPGGKGVNVTRALLANMVMGVSEGYRKVLEIQGVGYKAEIKGKVIVLSVGYANTISKTIPAGLTVAMEPGNKIAISGSDKQLVGQFASDLRRVRKPEPYKGKGLRYEGEVVKIKPGKAFAGAGAK